MTYVVHCRLGTFAGRIQSVPDYVAAERLADQWRRQGALKVEIREVDNSRDWNNTADPVVRQAERDEHDEG